MGITLRLAARKQGQQARGINIKGRCKKGFKKQLGGPLPPPAEEKETTLMLEALSIWARVRAFDS